MRYRVLFQWVVEGVYSAVSPSESSECFFATFITLSFLCLAITGVAFHQYAKVLGFSDSSAQFAIALFFLSPPILLAYVFPVHTREDPLAYLLVIFGLVALIRGNRILMVLFSVFGALTRETTLVLSFTYLVAGSGRLRERIVLSAIAPLTLLATRWWLGVQSYRPFDGATRNVEFPIESVFFLAMVFGVLWPIGVAGYFEAIRIRNQLPNSWRVLYLSAPIVLLLILVTNIALARVREIRIGFMFAPWLLPFAVLWFERHLDWFYPTAYRLSDWMKWIAFGGCLGAITFSVIYLGRYSLFTSAGALLLPQWLVVGAMHLGATIVVGCVVWRQMRLTEKV